MLLTSLILLPLVGAFPLLLVRDKNAREIKAWAFLAAFVTFLVSIALWTSFQSGPNAPLFQFEEKHAWINLKGIQANFNLGVDGFSSLMILLTTLLTPIAILSGWTRIADRQKEFYLAMLVLESAMIGVFAARDLFLFYTFFEASLLPMYFIIGIWGSEPSEQRFYATTKFVVYTALGSLLMFVGILYIYKISGSPDFSISNIADQLEVLRRQYVTDVENGVKQPRGFSHSAEFYCFWAFALAFGIKVAMVPLHTWLPDAYNSAPTPGLVLLSGIMAKMGGYGFYRFVIPFFPTAMEFYSGVFGFLAIVGIVYGSIMALAQKELKLVIAYSSIAHLSICMLGLFSGTDAGAHGALLQMVNHGIYSAGLFLMVGMLFERTQSRSMDYFGGIAQVVPNFTICFTILSLASIGLPLTNGFVGEFGCLMGAFEHSRRWALFGGLGVILGAAYMLIAIRKVFYGPLLRERSKTMPDLNRLEKGLLLPLLAMVFVIGVAPMPFLARLNGGVQDFLARGHMKEPAETMTARAPEAPPAPPVIIEVKPAAPRLEPKN